MRSFTPKHPATAGSIGNNRLNSKLVSFLAFYFAAAKTAKARPDLVWRMPRTDSKNDKPSQSSIATKALNSKLVSFLTFCVAAAKTAKAKPDFALRVPGTTSKSDKTPQSVIAIKALNSKLVSFLIFPNHPNPTHPTKNRPAHAILNLLVEVR